MNFCPVGALDYVAISHDAIYVDEKTAAARKLFSAHVECFDGDCGRFDSPHQIGKLILRVGFGRSESKDEDRAQKNKADSIAGRSCETNCFHYSLSISRDYYFCAGGSGR